MNKQCGLIIGILLFIIIGGVYKFMIQGDASEGNDGRLAIHLNEVERNLVLTEMRGFLDAVQKITLAIADDDMASVAQHAKKVGKAEQAGIPLSLMGKLPMSFKKLGSDTHKKFDQLALDAESLGDANQALNQLATLMQNCVTCHAGHRFALPE